MHLCTKERLIYQHNVRTVTEIMNPERQTCRTPRVLTSAFRQSVTGQGLQPALKRHRVGIPRVKVKSDLGVQL